MILQSLLLYICHISATQSQIAYEIPSFSDTGIIYRIVYGIWLVMLIYFLCKRNPILSGLQKQAVILQGLFFGIDLCLCTISRGLLTSISWITALIASPICAILCINDKFKNIFISLTNAFAISYLCCLILRITSVITAGVILVVLFFIFSILVSGSESLMFAFAKVFIITTSIVSIIDLVQVIAIFNTLHNSSIHSYAVNTIYFVLSALLMALVSVYVISVTYFTTWYDHKAEELKNKIKKQETEEVSV